MKKKAILLFAACLASSGCSTKVKIPNQAAHHSSLIWNTESFRLNGAVKNVTIRSNDPDLIGTQNPPAEITFTANGFLKEVNSYSPSNTKKISPNIATKPYVFSFMLFEYQKDNGFWNSVTLSNKKGNSRSITYTPVSFYPDGKTKFIKQKTRLVSNNHHQMGASKIYHYQYLSENRVRIDIYSNSEHIGEILLEFNSNNNLIKQSSELNYPDNVASIEPHYPDEYTYKWDEENMLNDQTTHYHWSSDDFLLTAESSTTNYTFSDYKTDHCNNWISRKVKEESNDSETSFTKTYKQNREITYYDDC